MSLEQYDYSYSLSKATENLEFSWRFNSSNLGPVVASSGFGPGQFYALLIDDVWFGANEPFEGATAWDSTLWGTSEADVEDRNNFGKASVTEADETANNIPNTLYYTGNMVSFFDLYYLVGDSDADGEYEILYHYADYPDGAQHTNNFPTALITDDTDSPLNTLGPPGDGQPILVDGVLFKWYKVLSYGEVLGDVWTIDGETTEISADYLFSDTDWDAELAARTEGKLNDGWPRNPTDYGSADFTNIGYIQIGDSGSCFLAGTLIATPTGDVPIEDLAIGDLVLTLEGARPVRFVSRNTCSPLLGAEVLPIRIQAGAVGAGLPRDDLYVSPGHSIFIGGNLVHASALVNGTTIRQVDMDHFQAARMFVYYNIELDQHHIITANGALVESYFDIIPRQQWDNFAEYMALYGADEPLQELSAPVIAHRRQLPANLRLTLQLNERQLVSASPGAR